MRRQIRRRISKNYSMFGCNKYKEKHKVGQRSKKNLWGKGGGNFNNVAREGLSVEK